MASEMHGHYTTAKFKSTRMLYVAVAGNVRAKVLIAHARVWNGKSETNNRANNALFSFALFIIHFKRQLINCAAKSE